MFKTFSETLAIPGADDNRPEATRASAPDARSGQCLDLTPKLTWIGDRAKASVQQFRRFSRSRLTSFGILLNIEI